MVDDTVRGNVHTTGLREKCLSSAIIVNAVVFLALVIYQIPELDDVERKLHDKRLNIEALRELCRNNKYSKQVGFYEY
jgi:cell division protein FtsL